MYTDIVEISTDFDFEQISRSIMGEEAWCYVFKGNKIKSKASGKKYNEATFESHPEGLYPPPCLILPTVEQVPQNHVKEWQGQMIVSSKVRNVMLCRKVVG